MITIDEFEDLLNESFPQVTIGRSSYGKGTILRKCDPEQFKIEYHDWLHYYEEA